MGTYRFSVVVDAPPEAVWDLWVDPDRAREWIEGITKVTDHAGTPGTTGFRYVNHFGGMRSKVEVLEAERPHRIRTRFGSWVLRGTTEATFTPDGAGTRIDQTFETEGVISAISARIFASGDYKGSFQGELEHFKRIAEADAAAEPAPVSRTSETI